MIPTNIISNRPVLLLGERVSDLFAGSGAAGIAVVFFLDLRLIQIPDCSAPIMKGEREPNNHNRTPLCFLIALSSLTVVQTVRSLNRGSQTKHDEQ